MLEDITLRLAKTNIRLKQLSGGAFPMGARENEIQRLIADGENPKYLLRELPEHTVLISSFYLQTTPVTIQQFSDFISETGHIPVVERKDNGSVFRNGSWEQMPGLSFYHSLTSTKENQSDAPATRIFYEDAKAFCNWLNTTVQEQTAKTGVFRLPTEAEFEFAASFKEGKKHLYSWESPEQALAYLQRVSDLDSVYSFPEERNGLRGLCGLLWQWCEDFYQEDFYQESVKEDPVNKKAADFRVLRGSSFLFPQRGLRTTYRSCPSGDYSSYGFRVALGKEIV